MSFSYYKVLIVLLTVLIGSSGRPVAQSMIVCTPTKVAGIVSGLLRSPCSETMQQSVVIQCRLRRKGYILVSQKNLAPKQF